MSAAWEHEWVDYYEILQVSPRAEPEVVEAAYHRLARKYHPDTGTGVLERMKRINVAKDVLCNPSARAKYDIAWQARERASSVTEEDVRRAREREQRAKNAAERAQREAREAQAQVEQARQDARAAQAAREAREAQEPQVGRYTGLAASVAGLDAPLHRQSEPAIEDAPGGSFSWLNLLANVARAALTPTVSGAWSSMDGLTYLIQQQGNQISFQGRNPFGMVIAVGDGQLTGRNLQLQYRLADGTSGMANAEISLDSRQISGMSTNLATRMTAPVFLSR